jgi:hypothetical protein
MLTHANVYACAPTGDWGYTFAVLAQSAGPLADQVSNGANDGQ